MHPAASPSVGSWRDTSNTHGKAIAETKWNCDGSLLFSSALDKVCKIGQLDPAGVMRPVQSINTTAPVSHMSWHPTDLERFAVAGDDTYVDVWDLRASRATGRILTTASNIFTAWSPDENYIAVGSKMDCISVLDVRNFKQVKRWKANYELNELAWSANSDHILIATGPSECRGAIDIKSFRDGDISHVSSVVSHNGSCLNLKVDPAYQRLAVGSTDFLVSLWNLNDMTCYATVFLDTCTRTISYSPDGRHLIVTGDNPMLSVIDTTEAEVVLTVPLKHPSYCASWNTRHAGVIAVAVEEKSNSEEHLVRLLNLNFPSSS